MAESGTETRVLHIEDEREFGELTQAYLPRQLEAVDVILETDPRVGLERLAEGTFDCVVCDYQMPGLDGLEVLESVREDLESDIPFIVFTGKGREAVAMEALNLGADRYVQKGGDPSSQFGVLAQAIEQEVEHHRTRAELERNADIFRDVFDTSGVGLLVFDPADGSIADANEVAAELFGYTRSELLTTRPSELSIPATPYSDQALETALDRAVSAGPQEVEWRGQRADGSETWVSAVLKAARIRGEKRVLGVLRDVTDRKAEQEELELFGQLIDHSNALIYVNDAETGEIRYANRTARETLGYDEGELIGKHVHEIEASFEDQTDWSDHLDEIRREGTMTFEGNQVRADGSTIPVEVDLAYVSLDSDYMVAIAHDIRDRRERERDIELFRELIDRANDEIYVIDEETGSFIDANDTAVEALGYDREALLSMGVPDISTMFEDVAAYRDYVDPPATGGPVQTEHVSADGTTHPVEIEASVATVDGEEYRIAIARDIEGREAREQMLAELHGAAREIEAAESEDEVFDRLVGAAESILSFDLVAVDVCDGSSLVQRAYSRAVGSEGYYNEVSLDEDTFSTRAFHTGETIVVDDLREHEITPADPRYLSALTVPIGEIGTFQTVASEVGAFDDSDRELAELLVGHATETLRRLRSERHLRSQKQELKRQNERLEEFASIVSHDLRNPLTVARGRLDLLAEECPGENVERIAESLDRMDSLIQDTLEMARGSQAVRDLDEIEIGSFADRCLDAVESSGARLDVASPFRVRADRDRLQQVFENLFRNAVQHAGPEVTVSIGRIDGDGFYVEDDGQGIPPDQRSKVFDRGYTTDDSGTGFGLAIIDEIVEAHEWELALTESEEGGARFEFRGVEVEALEQ